MTELIRRTLTGGLLAPAILAAVWLGPYSFTLLLILINLLSLREFYHLLEMPAAKPLKISGALLSLIAMLTSLAAFTGFAGWKWLLLIVPSAFLVFVHALYRPVKNPFQSLAITFFGVITITLPLCCFAGLPFLPQPAGSYHFALPLSCFLLLWSNDTAAYLFGRSFGKHPLFLRISPKKTWEGSVAGAMAAAATAYMLSRYVGGVNVIAWEILSAIVVVAETYGDLIKSLLKRSAGVKDSGTILPGHGGMLDRFDSLLGSAPFIYSYLILLWK